MSFTLSRLMSTATASYGVYCFVEPRHLGSVISSEKKRQETYDVLAHTYGARDLVISSFGILGRSDTVVTAAMLARITLDLADAAVLSRQAESDEARQKVLGVTLGWAALNTLALLVDRRRAKRSRGRVETISR